MSALDLQQMSSRSTVGDEYRLRSGPKPNFEVQDRSDMFGPGDLSVPNKITFTCKSKGVKTRFYGGSGGSFVWERQGKKDIFDLWVTEGLPAESSSFMKRSQTRKVGTMKRSTNFDTDSKRVVIDANTRYIGEVAMLASALTVLKKDALEEKQKNAMSMYINQQGF
ncbi:hypothetical protein DRE_04312 [Drechslerella stenobrocha 248]|uniref:Uncharacterized protein n=1 Tax=Drechslerella stenobrocha 248 TaxID=1043628 RepID=W7HSV9_9PEZI|nr:hypothetical protein DRE_04312 [Drechslerella stenobrocha 248]